jgi:FAD/FMN-containing dehydrogenase
MVITAHWRDDYQSWGRTLAARHQVVRPGDPEAAARCIAETEGLPVLAFGCGRSYGDVPLNPGGLLIDCRGLDRFIAFDRERGLLTCEAGVQLADILAVVCRPEADGSGWLLPVTPGTRFVTVGGAIANDVHGKNHHGLGTFGRHVLSLELARSDGSLQTCSTEMNSELFAGTIGGLGLTGLILRATIQMRRVAGLAVEAQDIRFDRLDDFFDLAGESDEGWEYTAAWIDCLASGRNLGRGIYSRARHAPGRGTLPPAREPRLTFPVTPPISLATPLTVRAFNALYWHKRSRHAKVSRVESYEPVFYPLDAVGSWNRIYGPRGFYQFQCVVPPQAARDSIAQMLRMIAGSRQGSMLAVLKTFGDRPSPGLMSFPMPGTTLGLDFPNRGEATRHLLAQLERVVSEAGGRLYPAKDRLMSPETLRNGYPWLERFRSQIDPGFSSAFARRVGLIDGGEGKPKSPMS